MNRFAVSFLSVMFCACVTEDDVLTDLQQDLGLDTPEAQDAATQLAMYCPGHRRGADIPTYRGLAGTYVRLGLGAEGEPSRLTLTPEHDHPDAAGTFRGTWAGATGQPSSAETGTFLAMADNPAIGPVVSFDFGGDHEWDQGYFVLGVRRSIMGKVSSLCLVAGKTPFMLVRALF